MSERSERRRKRRNRQGDGSGPRGSARAPLERRRRFVDAFLETGNATHAAIRAGYARKGAAQQASRLLKIVQVAELIRERQLAASNTEKRVATRQDRQAMWTAMMEAAGEFKDKITISERQRAMELLGKSQADFVEVRMAPIVTDSQMGEEELVAQVGAIMDRIRKRVEQQAANGSGS
jgi:phage terminase small subunit